MFVHSAEIGNVFVSVERKLEINRAEVREELPGDTLIPAAALTVSISQSYS